MTRPRLVTYWRLQLVALVSLAAAFATSLIGIGVFEALLMRPPGVPAAGELVTLFVRTPHETHGLVSFPEYAFYRDQNEALTGTAATAEQIELLALTVGDRHELANASFASSNFFDVLHVHAAIGDLRFPPDEGAGEDTAVVGHALWVRLGSDPAIAGQTILLNRHPVTVIGVAPATFGGMMLAFEPDVWLPLRMMAVLEGRPPATLQDRTRRSLMIIGRLRAGLSRDQATANLSALSSRMAAAFPESDRGRAAFLVPTTVIPADTRPELLPFVFLVLAVILMALAAAGANVTNVAASLAVARRREMLIRSALGASRRQLATGLLRESVMTAMAGGVLGFGLAYATLAWLTAIKPVLGPNLPRVAVDLRPDATVAVIAGVLVLAVGIVTGLWPAWRAARDAATGALHTEVAPGVTTRGRLRSALVVVQVAAATLVMIAVGWSMRSVGNLRRADPGFSERQLVAADLDLPLNHYTPGDGRRLAERARERLVSLPGVQSVSIAEGMQLGAIDWGRDRVRADTDTATAELRETQVGVIDDQYFATLGITLIAGRGFDVRDSAHRPEVAIVNRTLANQCWPDGRAVGRHLRIESGPRVVEVVGIAADGRYSSVDEVQAPFMYFARSQHELDGSMTIVVRTAGEAAEWRAPLTEVLRRLDPALEFRVSTLEDQLGASMIVPRLTLVCVSAFAAVALLLASGGLFSIVHHAVSTRRREMGVRIALGATPRDLFRIVLGETSRLAGTGAAAGLGMAMMALPVVSSLFFGVAALDTLVVGSVLAATFVLATATAYAAARPCVRSSAVVLLRDP